MKDGKCRNIFLAGIIVVFCISFHRIRKLKDELKRHTLSEERLYNDYSFFNRWLYLEVHGENVGKWLTERQYRRVAIYGLGRVGNILYESLNKSNLCIEYAIDENRRRRHASLDVYTCEDEWPEADIIIVTPLHNCENICTKPDRNISCPVISLKEIIDDIYDNMKI